MLVEEKKPAERVLAAIDSEPWLITQDGFAKIREIASRENLSITLDDLSKIEERREALAAKRAAKLDGAAGVQKRDRIAIIDVNGPIFRYADLFTSISGGTTTETLATDFNLAMDDPSVDGVLFNVDSPGGQAKGINELSNMVRSRRGEKPIGTYIGGDAGSAAYFFVSAADPGLIGIDATGFAGSIGAVIAVRKDKPNEKDKSVTLEFVSKQSPDKRLDPETEAGGTELQRRADALGGVFVDAVATNRGVTQDRVLSDFGRGRMLMGEEAVKAGLADEVTSMESMIRKLKDRRRQNYNASPRTSAETKARGDNMTFTPEFKKSIGLAETATDVEVQAAVTELRANSARTVAAEANAKKVAAIAQVDCWEREGKISGSSTAKVRDLYVAASTGEKITPEMISGMVDALPKLDTTRISKDAVGAGGPSTTVSLDDFAKAATNVECSKKIQTAVMERKKTNPKFTASMLERELRSAASR